MITGTKTVRHRDGTSTTWERVKLPLAEVARRVAIWLRIAPVGKRDAAGIEYHVEREGRRYINPDGTPAVVTRLHVSTSAGAAFVTKTRLGEYFGARIDRLDEDGVEFWEDRNAQNKWILADVFAI